MAKKKPAKPQRAVATTSVASKKQIEAAEAAIDAAAEPVETVETAKAVEAAEATPDWEDERASEDAELQGLVDRLHDKADKEVTRVIKGLEYDKRMSKSFPTLLINDTIRDRILELALENDAADTTSLTPAATPTESDKTLQRIFVAYNVLLRLGFSEARVTECLLKGIGSTEGWEEALEWMWLHLPEDECLSRGQYVKEELLVEDVAPLLAASPSPPPTPDRPLSAPPSPPIKSSPPRTSLFQSSCVDSDTEPESEPDLDRASTHWAELMLKLDDLKLSADKKKRVPVGTTAMRALKAQIAEAEKDYMFRRKDADTILRSLKARRNAEALEARLKSVPAAPSTPEASDDEGDLLGNLLDIPDEPQVADTPDVTTSLVTTRSMPIPKATGNVPKAILRSALAKTTVLTFVKISGHSRAVRAGLEIGWSPERRKVWKMDDIACENLQEAENYVATIALHELLCIGEVTAVNWRALPPAYRDLWEELETSQKARQDMEKRRVWARMRELIAQKGTKPVNATAQTASKLNAAPSSSSSSSTTTTSSTLAFDAKLQDDFLRRHAAATYQKMYQYRQTLPIASFRERIVQTLETSQVMVLSGETGCGKSTQLPSFLLEDHLASGKPCKIYVTEPRRISAISLAQRVSQELGDAPGAMGTNASLVGYSIRLEAKMSPATRLAFVTNGIALRMLEGGSGFDEVTHFIIDEVHERSIESDFLLIVLKQLMQQRPDLKVVLMSATLDAEKISNFFDGCPTLSVPGRTFPVQVKYLEDAVETTGWHIDETSPYAIRPRNRKTTAKQMEWDDVSGSESDEDPAKLSSTRYSESTVSTVNLLDSRQIPYELIVQLLEKVCYEEELVSFSKAVLVFMPGLAEIRKLHDILQAHPAFGCAQFVIYPLHSTISSEGQSAVFDVPREGIRKIVISTNIAETGVTIPDITCVIDTGKHREMRYDEKRQISRLVETYIAKSNAKQRRGRAGRVQAGLAFHLFTKARHDTQLALHPIPEMLRLSLQDLALRIKVLKVKLGATIEEVLLQALDPPSPLNIQRAVAALIEVKALTAAEEITPMGRLLSKLPMDVHLGKLLLVAALFKCLDPALTIAATLNSKSPFVTPFGFEGQADAAKRSFAVGNSDFLTLVNVFNSWRRASEDPNFVRVFCKRNFLSQQNLQQIEELRQQLLSYLIDSSFLQVTPEQRREISQARYNKGFRTRFIAVPLEYNVNADNSEILGASLAAGLYPKLLSVEVGFKTITNQQPVAMHPSSINFRVPKGDLACNYLAYFTLMQSKKLYAWESGPVSDRALALLCGDNVDIKVSASSLSLDRRIKYQLPPKTAIALKLLRERFATVMASKMRGRALDHDGERWFALGIECIGDL